MKPGIPTTIKTMGVNITTIVYLRVFIIEIGSTIILMVVEFSGINFPDISDIFRDKLINSIFSYEHGSKIFLGAENKDRRQPEKQVFTVAVLLDICWMVEVLKKPPGM